jgi:hypothetical protein
MPINEKDLDFPEAWRPKVGDFLIGKVTGVDERDGEYGTYPIVTVETEDGKRLAFHAFHTVARGELARLRPKAGDEIGIKYHGKDAERGYERYTMRVDRPGAEVDWDKHAAETESVLTGAVDEQPPF